MLERIVVIGVGLIGGSLAAAAKALPQPVQVRGIDVSTEDLAYAREHGLIDDGLDPEQALRAGWLAPGAADVVFVATPASAAEGWLETIGGERFDGIVTDVASTKSGVLAAAKRHLRLARFVGGHPMAGSERSGVKAASAKLFEGAYYVLTPTSDTDMSAYKRLHSFLVSVGARVITVDPVTHDEAVAVISHVPHVAASALTNLAAARSRKQEALLRLAAGGFKDMTRIAAGSPELWAGICIDNAEAILAGIDDYSAELAEFREALSASDRDALRAWLAEAAEVRRALPAQWVPATAVLTEVTVPVIDRPGVVSEVTLAVSRSGCNIEDIEIDHRSEDSAMLRLVLTDEGDIEALLADLSSLGYSPQTRSLSDATGNGSSTSDG